MSEFGRTSQTYLKLFEESGLMKHNFVPRFAAGLFSVMAALGANASTVVYDSLGPSVFNLPSQGYQATSTSELGDRIGFGAGPRGLDSVTVRMSTWALQSTYAGNPTYASAAGYDYSLTFNIYGTGTGANAGALIATKTLDTIIPWRPEADSTCDGGTAWRATDGNCYNGKAFDVVFDFSALGIELPDEIVFGLAFNTQSYGSAPTGVDGPYNSLNFGLSGGATTGTDVNNDAAFWNTSYGGFLTNSANAGQFREDVGGWQGFVPAVQFATTDVPEPGSLALVGLALFALGASRRKRAA